MHRHIHLLPEEILKEILNAFLHIPDSTFADPDARFGRNALSTSRILLVCRRWLRIATPLLYRIVILRSVAQAQALAAVLEYHPYLGKYVRKLRVEGGYGSSMRTILQRSPGISDLYISVSFRSSDRTSGLCQGISSINPSRVVIFDAQDNKESSNHDAVINALCVVLPTWKRLTTVELAVAFRYDDKRRMLDLASALTKPPALKRVFVQKQTFDAEIIRQTAKVLDKLGESPSLKSVQYLRRGFSSQHRMNEHIHAVLKVITSPKIAHLLQVREESPSPCYAKPSQHSTAVHPMQYANMIQSSSSVHHPSVSQYPTALQYQNTVQVPHMNVLPNAVQYAHGTHYSNAMRYPSTMPYPVTTQCPNAIQYPNMTQYIKSGYLSSSSTSSRVVHHALPRRRRPRGAAAFDANICASIIQACIQLSVPQRRLPDYHAFQDERVAGMTASQRVCFNMLCVSKTFYAAAIPFLYYKIVIFSNKGINALMWQLARYPQLTKAIVHLAIDSAYYRTSKSISDSASLVEKLVGMIPSLQTLNAQLFPASLRSIGKLAGASMRELHVCLLQDNSDAAALCRDLEAMDLNALAPSGKGTSTSGGILRVFSLTAYGPVKVHKLKYWDLSAVTFLKLNLSKHVPVNIRNTFLVLCPNVQVLYIGHYDIAPDAELFRIRKRNNILKKVVILMPAMKPNTIAEMDTFIYTVDLHAFYALQEIQFADMAWPNSEHDIKKSHLLRWTEMLKTKFVGEVTDYYGRVWRPRAQKTSKRTTKLWK